MTRVAICAAASVRFERDIWTKRFQEMAYDCVEEIVRQSGVTWDEDRGVTSVVTCSDDVYDARTISDNAMTDAVGAHFRGEEKVAMDGLNAIGYALACILSGHDAIVLVVGHCKESQAESRQQVENLGFDPFFTRPLGLDGLSAAALQARAYMERSGLTDAHLARVVARSRRQAARNPRVTGLAAVTEEEVLGSPLVCDPLREAHVHPVSDGAVALLLAREDRVLELTDHPVWIRGFANCMDRFFLGDRDLSQSGGLEKAAARAYRMAGIDDPRSHVDLFEINDPFAHQLPLHAEALGLCESGASFIESDGLDRHRVNLSGGMLAGNPAMLGGMARALEAVLQLRGEAGAVQADGVRRAVAHGTTGPAGQHQAVLVLERS